MARMRDPLADEVVAWVDAAAMPLRRCVICTHPKGLDFLRAALVAMNARGVRVSRGKLAAKLSDVLGVKVHENSLRNHLLQGHDPKAKAMPSRVPRG